ILVLVRLVEVGRIVVCGTLSLRDDQHLCCPRPPERSQIDLRHVVRLRKLRLEAERQKPPFQREYAVPFGEQEISKTNVRKRSYVREVVPIMTITINVVSVNHNHFPITT